MNQPDPTAADRAALRDRIAEALYAHDHPSHVVPLNGTGMVPAYRESADAVLVVLPEPTDRAADGSVAAAQARLRSTAFSLATGDVALKPGAFAQALGEFEAAVRAEALREGADAIDCETEQLKRHGVLEPDKYPPCRDASAQLRRLAGEQPAQDEGFVPPAAMGLPAGTLEAAEIGASALDAWARTPSGRNFLAHALVQLARTGWLRTEPGEGFRPLDPAAPPAAPQSV